MLYEYFSNQITLFQGILYLVAIIVSLSIHEFCHAISAKLLGDTTPVLQGRVTLNPLAHMDPIGMIALILTNFGWGRPVQINPANFKRPAIDSAIVSALGPLSNLFLAVLAIFLLRMFYFNINANGVYMLEILIVLNIGLMLFNLIPLPPLDGSKIFALVLPARYRFAYETFLNRYVLLFWIFLAFPLFNGQSIISMILSPVVLKILSLVAII